MREHLIQTEKISTSYMQFLSVLNKTIMITLFKDAGYSSSNSQNCLKKSITVIYNYLQSSDCKYFLMLMYFFGYCCCVSIFCINVGC